MKIKKNWKDFDFSNLQSSSDGPKFRRNLKRSIINLRDGVKMSCYAKCVPSCRFSWFKNDGVETFENITTAYDESQLKVVE